MQSWTLTADRILDHAAAARPHGEIDTLSSTGGPLRTTYAQLAVRAQRLAAALAELGVRRGETVTVAAGSTLRQLEAWYALMGMGAVSHPVNPRLGPEPLAALLSAGGGKLAFVDPAFLPTIEPALRRASGIEQLVLMAEDVQILNAPVKRVLAQDVLVAQGGRAAAWGGMDEEAPALLVHTVGVGEAPKAVIWPHRACVLQALIGRGPEGLGLSPNDTVMPLVPFWRAAAWGVAFSAPAAGARLVLPGDADMARLRTAIDQQDVTVVVASPGELQALHDEFAGRRPRTLRRALAVGALCPPSLAAAWAELGVNVRAAWGLTETAAAGPAFDPRTGEPHPPFGLEMEVTDAAGRPVPHDGVSIGSLRVRGPTVAAGYFPRGAALDDNGFLDTGDLAAIDSTGAVRLMGRADDLVEAAGARVSAQAAEAAALEHPATAEAAVIDPPSGFGEGPLLVVRRKPGATASRADYLRHLRDRLGASAPAQVLFVDGLPTDAAGRADKRALAERLTNLPAPAAAAPEPLLPAPATEAPLLTPVAAEAALSPAIYEPEPEPEPVSEPTPEPELAATAQPAEAELSTVAAPPAEPGEEAAEPPVASDAVAHAEPAEPETPISSGLEPGAEALEEAPPPQEEEPAALPQAVPSEAGLFGALRPEELTPAPFAAVRRPRGKPKASGAASLFLDFGVLVAVAPLLSILAGVALVRADVIDWRFGLGELIMDWPFKLAMVGVVIGILGVFAALMAGFSRLGARAVICLLLPLAVLGAFLGVKSWSAGYPPVQDAATDWTDPIAFSPALIKARGAAAYPIQPDPIVPQDAGTYINRRVAEVNAETCAGARPAVLALPPDQAYQRAKQAVLADGLQIVGDDPADGRLEATATGLVLGFEDDLAVRVKPDAKGSRVDLRSASRNLVSTDLGVNCDRVIRISQAIAGG